MPDRSLRSRLGPLALVVAALLLGSFRPLPRLNHRLTPCGLHLLAMALEPGEGCDGGTNALPIGRATAGYATPIFLALTGVLVVLKLRRLAIVPIVVRRVKLFPPSPPAESLPLR